MTKLDKWQCMRSGHCCEVVGHVTMTLQEQRLIVDELPSASTLTWEDIGDGFVRLEGNPACPFLGKVDGQPGCTIHDIRPYNCRRWGCFRSSKTEDFDVKAVAERIVNDRSFLRQAKLMQRRAQRWARKYGWGDSDGV